MCTRNNVHFCLFFFVFFFQSKQNVKKKTKKRKLVHEAKTKDITASGTEDNTLPKIKTTKKKAKGPLDTEVDYQVLKQGIKNIVQHKKEISAKKFK